MNLQSYRTKRMSYACVLILLSVSVMAGCAKPTPTAFSNVCQKENDKKYISVEGYLRTGASVLCSSRNGTRTCGLELAEKPDGESKISVYVEEGTGTGQMEPLPKSYGRESLKLHAGDGSILGAQDRVRIIGKANTATDAINASYTICFIDVDKIEKP